MTGQAERWVIVEGGAYGQTYEAADPPFSVIQLWQERIGDSSRVVKLLSTTTRGLSYFISKNPKELLTVCAN